MRKLHILNQENGPVHFVLEVVKCQSKIWRTAFNPFAGLTHALGFNLLELELESKLVVIELRSWVCAGHG